MKILVLVVTLQGVEFGVNGGFTGVEFGASVVASERVRFPLVFY